MYTLFALVLTATAVVIARPPGPAVTTAGSDDETSPIELETPTRKYLRDYLLPRYLWPHYVAYEETRDPQPQLPATDWLSKEIERLSQMQERAELSFDPEDPNILSHNYFMKRFIGSAYKTRESAQKQYEEQQLPSWVHVMSDYQPYKKPHRLEPAVETRTPTRNSSKKTDFALTPLDEGYFELIENDSISSNVEPQGMHEGGGQANMMELEPRQTRQNPNNRNLVSGNLERLVIGLSNKEYRLPVSLLPSNLRWLKHYRSVNESNQDGLYATESPRLIRTRSDTMDFEGGSSFYGVAVVSAIGAAVVMALLAFAIGWYTLSKRAKAAAEVDYPAYGVTGPTIDSSGDRKLAHSAHMYHYQHQKQQIIAMERNGMEQRNGSVSDPESEDENEEGDYTVYECPGFATTGDMEVKNPLFNEDPTPATPGTCEVVKPQPKD